jgi:hypothetical protein
MELDTPHFKFYCFISINKLRKKKIKPIILATWEAEIGMIEF